MWEMNKKPSVISLPAGRQGHQSSVVMPTTICYLLVTDDWLLMTKITRGNF